MSAIRDCATAAHRRIHQGARAPADAPLNSIQVLRGIAAAAVMFGHAALPLKLPFPTIWTTAGVDMFFVVSGFIIFMVMERAGSGGTAARHFLLRRAARLLPLYWLCTLVVIAHDLQLGAPASIGQIVASFLLFPDVLAAQLRPPLVHVGWTLLYEFYFYLLAALAIGWGLRPKHAFAAVAAVMGLVWLTGQGMSQPPQLLEHYASPLVAEFLIGGGLALCAPRLRSLGGGAWKGGLAIGLGIVVFGLTWRHPESQHGSLNWAASAGLLCLGALLLEDGIRWKYLRPLVSLGNSSYSLYLTHMAVVYAFGEKLFPSLDRWVSEPIRNTVFLTVVCAVSIALAHAVYVQFERPMNLLLLDKMGLGRPVVERRPVPPLLPYVSLGVVVGLTVSALLPLVKEAVADWLDGGRSVRLVAYGTSLTAYQDWTPALEGADPCGRPYRASNMAQGGATSNWGVMRLDRRVIAKKPDIVLLEFSINDARLGNNISLDKSVTNAEAMIRQLREENPKVRIFLMTMNPVWGAATSRHPDLATYYAAYADVGRRTGVSVIDHHAAWQSLATTDPELFQRYIPDGIHPSMEGHLAVTVPGIRAALRAQNCL